MQAVTQRTRDALLLMSFAFPALAQNDGPTVEDRSRLAADTKKVPQKAYQELRDDLTAKQKAGVEGIESLLGKPQILVGAYPHRYEIKERKALADGAFEAAQEIAQQDHQRARWWINFPRQDVAARMKPGIELLQLSKKEIFSVVNDSFDRAKALGLLKLDGTSTTPIDAPFVGGVPFEMNRMSIKGFPGRPVTDLEVERPLLPEGVVFRDNSTRSRPEISTGELQGRNLLAGSAGQDDTAGLVDFSGDVEKTTHTTKKVQWRDPRFVEERRSLNEQIMAKAKQVKECERALASAETAAGIADRPRSTIGQQNRLAQAKKELDELNKTFRGLREKYPWEERDEKTAQTDSVKVNGSTFIGPVGSKGPQNSQDLLEVCQQLIEGDHRERGATMLLEVVGDGKKLFGSDPDRTLRILGQERQRNGGVEKAPPLQSVTEVTQYLTDLAFGLTDDAAMDLRRLANDMLLRSKGDHERTQWREVLTELDRVIPEVQLLRKTDTNHPEARRINWSRFKFTLPLETVAPGMLYERLRVD